MIIVIYHQAKTPIIEYIIIIIIIIIIVRANFGAQSRMNGLRPKKSKIMNL